MTVEHVRGTLHQIGENFRAAEALSPLVAEAAERVIAALQAGNRVMFCGNGGSAADAQHLAAELVGRYLRDRRPLPALALTVDTSALTAIANDYGYEEVFARQLAGLGRAGDVLVALTTSGNSPNVLRAAAVARTMGIVVIGMTGAGGGALAQACDLCIRVPADRADRVQELHIAIGHILCGLIEAAVCG